MRLKTLAGSLLACACLAQALHALPYEELTPKFDRKKSRTMIRKIKSPTLANLDYAAYTDNPVLHDPKKLNPKAPPQKVSPANLTFDGVVADVCNGISETPLTDAEKDAPMAWTALVNRLWKEVKDPKFPEITAEVDGEKWADHNVTKPYQRLTDVYLHERDGATDFWVKIEFAPWVKFLEGITDEDADGFPEVYGRLTLSGLDEDVLKKTLEWIKTEYTSRELTADQINDWIMVLASYWYPTYNTDIIPMEGATTWPTKDSDKGAVKKLKGFTVENPIAVVKGNPLGKVIYNIYVVEGVSATAEEEQPDATGGVQNKVLDSSESKSFKGNYDRMKKELEPFGTYNKWAGKTAAVVEAQKKFLAGLPEGQMGFKGKDDWVFFRKSLEMMVAGDLAGQPKDKNALPHLVELKAYLDAQNANLLFVPIPNKEDVYYEHLPFDMPKETDAIINPYFRKFLKDAQDAGIEVVDVLPALLAAKAEDKFKGELYQRQDTHWTNRGLQIVAKLIADRIKEYSWFEEAAKTGVEYSLVDTTFLRQGDIIERLPEADRSAYPAVKLAAQQVRKPDGKPYKGSKGNPILLIGDSFTGVFELVDCKSAGVGAHVAAKSGLPVDIITSWGGGPPVRKRMMRTRKDHMGTKRLVIYLMVARDLYNYAMGWEPLLQKKK